MKALIDNDVLLKGACYGLLDELVEVVPASPPTVGVLGLARFVLPSKIRKRASEGTVDEAHDRLSMFLEKAVALETTEEETELAAELEYQAQVLGLPFDGGESQLCAILLLRDVPKLVTGDKRALAAAEKLLELCPRLHPASGKMMCLEQLILRLVTSLGPHPVRAVICRQPRVDTALSICFSCANEAVTADSFAAGLRSYIGSLRAAALRLLASD